MCAVYSEALHDARHNLCMCLRLLPLTNLPVPIIQCARLSRVVGDSSLLQHLRGMKVGIGSRALQPRPQAKRIQRPVGMAARCGTRSNMVLGPQDCALGRTGLAGQPFSRVGSRQSSR